jgi:hypothetical protein
VKGQREWISRRAFRGISQTRLEKLQDQRSAAGGDFEILLHAGREFVALDFGKVKHAAMLNDFIPK